LALALGLFTGISAWFLPRLAELQLKLGRGILAFAPVVAIPLVIFGYAAGLLEGALSCGITGEDRRVLWSGPDVKMAMKHAFVWLVCFLCGPVLLAGTALLYWIQCGDPEFLDQLILAELGTVAVCYWMFAILAVNQRGRLQDANPFSVADQIHGLRIPALLLVFLATLVALVHARLLLSALGELRSDTGGAMLSLIGYWASALGWDTFLFRLLGAYCQPNEEGRAKP
jgi:hypothetical protein